MPDDKILKLWGKGKIKSDAKYRLMAYVLLFECNGVTLLHNCVTGQLIEIDAEENVLNQLPADYNNKLDLLIENRFLVPTEFDDKKAISQLRTAFKIMYAKKDIIAYTILPTTACNARCFYCYESGVEHINMSKQTAEKLVAFIKQHNGKKPIEIEWFGGEPLLCVERIDQICQLLKENGVEFYSTITTNGFLFNKELVSHAKTEWNLKSAQITVDGTEEVYNKTKAYVNVNESPYKKVMENIGHLLKDEITVKMRMNLSKENGEDLKSLIEDVGVRFKGEKIYSLMLR